MRTESGLRVVPIHDPHTPGVKIRHEGQDHPDPHEDKRTRFRFFGDVPREPKDVPLDHRPYFSPRDRDLGQTFTTPADAPLRLSAVTLRIGSVDLAVGPGARGRPVSMQFFRRQWYDPKAASLLDWDNRLNQPPNTWGRPDVDTYRVLTLIIEGT
jgi:hypothetical protein